MNRRRIIPQRQFLQQNRHMCTSGRRTSQRLIMHEHLLLRPFIMAEIYYDSSFYLSPESSSPAVGCSFCNSASSVRAF